MKGPGLRIDVDVRRAWLCPVCGQGQRLTMDITAPRCLCVRDGVPLKLAEGQRPGRLALRPELRSMLDRIQGGEEFPRRASPLDSDGGSGGYGGSKSRSRSPRPERSGGYADRPPGEPQSVEPQGEVTTDPEIPLASTQPVVTATPQAPELPDDDFGAGLGAGETSAT